MSVVLAATLGNGILPLVEFSPGGEGLTTARGHENCEVNGLGTNQGESKVVPPSTTEPRNFYA